MWKVCLLRRANTGYMDGKYCFPAGHKEPGEAPLVGAVREALEETGVTVDPSKVVHRHTMHRFSDVPHRHERVAYFFVADSWMGEPTNMESAKCDHMDWFAFDALPDMVPYMRDALMHVRAGVPYSESTH